MKLTIKRKKKSLTSIKIFSKSKNDARTNKASKKKLLKAFGDVERKEQRKKNDKK